MVKNINSYFLCSPVQPNNVYHYSRNTQLSMFTTSFGLIDYYLVFHTALLCRRHFSGSIKYLSVQILCEVSTRSAIKQNTIFFPKLSSNFLFRTKSYNQNSEFIPLIWKAKSCRYHVMKNIGRVGTPLCIPNLSSRWLLQTSPITCTHSIFQEFNWMWQ